MIIGTKYALFPTKRTTFLESISKVLFSCKIEKKNIVPNKVKNNLLGKPEKITLESKLNEDLDADSIDIADVVMDIEEKYGFEFSDEDAENIVAIKDLVRVIEERK